MKTFLYSVAEDIFNKLQVSGEDLTSTAIIFPNKRAGLFFNEYIARLAKGKPLWSPNYMTISELFSTLSPRKKSDNILLVCELYQEYIKLAKNDETLDHFYGWGEMILKDFDDVDKNMVDASALFHNLDDLKDIENTIDYLSDEQKESIRIFFNHFQAKNDTLLQQHFRTFWNILPDLYINFNNRLQQEGTAYEGALYREAVTSLNTDDLPYKHYAFVGFNVLNAVEHALLKKIKDSGKGWFYWDYDTYYLADNNQEAGWFISQDLKEFPNELPVGLFRNLEKSKDITYVSAPTGNAQARYLPQWLSENMTTPEKETAVVLCDETLLQPVLHSIPDNVEEINVTMGFPLTNTPVYSLLTGLMSLQDTGYDIQEDRFHYDQVANVLKHPYLQLLSNSAESLLEELTCKNRFFPLRTELSCDETLAQIFGKPSESILGRINYLSDILRQIARTFQTNSRKGERMETQLYKESLFNAYTTLERFHKLAEDKILQITSPKTLIRLLTRVLSSISIPFHGEPAKGLQIMGVLETRNLDFKHLIMLSVNEGNLPKGINENSLIPYNLRVAYGLTTIRHQVSVYAYYFYRLLQRAEKVTLIYNEGNSGGLGKGEMSRFMLQYKLESGKHIREISLSPSIRPTEPETITVDKTPELLLELASAHNDIKHYLSPTALNCYLSCPLKFYFTYVGNFRDEDEVSSIIDPRYFGNIFHRAAELLYTDMREKTVTASMLEDVVKSKLYERYVSQAFNENFFQLGKDEKATYNGEQLIKRDLILQYMLQLIACDKRNPFKIIGLEKNVVHTVNFTTAQNVNYQITIGGKIDRLDKLIIDGEERTRIVDYKTGGSPQQFRTVEQLFNTNSPTRPDKIFQTFLYAYIVYKEMNIRSLTPALFFVHKSFQSDYQPELQINKKAVLFDTYVENFEVELRHLLEKIFNLNEPFVQTEDTTCCSYCSFRYLCRR